MLTSPEARRMGFHSLVRASPPGTRRRVQSDTDPLEGGYSVLEVATHEEALEWAWKIAVACRCAQEVRVLGDDPEG